MRARRALRRGLQGVCLFGMCVSGFLMLCFASDSASAEGNEIPPRLELAVNKGLEYLRRTQRPEGYWDDNYGRTPAVVGLVVLAHLAHGDMPGPTRAGVAMKKGIHYILSCQQADGTICSMGGTTMYEHGFSTLALAEVYGCTQDERVGKALKRAVDLIVRAQNSLGGWRYSVGATDADVTVVGCQLMALRAAANAGIEVPAATVQRAAEYIKKCACPDGGFAYQANQMGGAGTAKTGIGVLLLSLCGHYRSPEVKAGAEYLLKQPRERGGYYDYYGVYYCSQAMFQAGGEYWKRWNEENMSILLGTQSPDGSWGGRGEGGTTYSTAMALLSLEVNYKLLPIYQR